jgi:hypothetical protein
MDKLKHIVKVEIDDITNHSLSPALVGVLGQLVDIYKDIEYVEYMHCKEQHMRIEESHMYNDVGDGVSASEMRYVEDSLNAYKNSKKNYLTHRDAASKNKMLHDLQAVMDSYGVAIKDVWNGSDSEEERVLIRDSVTKRFLS